MAIKGVFSSDSAMPGDRPGDFATAVLKVMPTGKAPLLALSSGMASADASDVIITWFEENHMSGRSSVVGAVNSSATSIVINDASMTVVGTTFLLEATGEMVFVIGINGNTLTIQRGFGSSVASNIADGAAIQRIGTAYEEGSNRPQAIANIGQPRMNYMQIFRNSWNITGTANAVKYRTGDKTSKNKQDCMALHAEDIERSLIWGRKAFGVFNNEPFRTMDGINAQIQTNRTVATGPITWDDIDTFFMNVFSKNIQGKPNERIAFCGNQVISVLQSIARIEGTIWIEAGQNSFGLNIWNWITPYGSISLQTHPLMVENPSWTKDLYVYHPGAIRTRYLRRTSPDNDDRPGTRNGVDADTGVLTTEMSVEYAAEKTGGLFTGISEATAVS